MTKRATKRQMECQRIAEEKARRMRRRVLWRRGLLAGGALCTLLMAGGIYMLLHSPVIAEMQRGIETAWLNSTARLGFRVEHVYLEGRENTSMEAIHQALDLEPGASIFHTSMAELKARLEKVDRIHQAAVERVLPDTLHIHIRERTPVAVWQNKGQLYLIDHTGLVMEGWNIEHYRHLPIMVGEDAPSHTPQLLTMLDKVPALRERVRAAVRVSERRWNVRLDNDLEVKLPEQDAEATWLSFARMVSEQHLLDKAVTSVDLRLPDRAFIKVQPDAIAPASGTKAAPKPKAQET